MHLTELTTAQSSSIALIGSLVSLVVFAAYYVWVAWALSRVFVKLGEPAWKGWVPIVNQLTIYTLGGFSALWVISLFFPIVQIAGYVVLCFAIHTITKRFGKGPGYTVLGILLLPIWATILGFGKAQPVDGSRTDVAAPAQPSPFESRMAGLAPAPGVFPPMPPTAAYEAPAPDPLIFRPVADVGPVPPMPPTPPVPPVPSAPPVPAAAPVAPVVRAAPPVAAPVTPPVTPTAIPLVPAPVTPSEAPAADPWAPPIASIPGFDLPVAPVAASAPAPVPAPVPALVSPPAPSAPAADVEADTDETVLKRRGPSWVLDLPDGGSVSLTNAIVLLGRNPAATGDSVGAQLVALADPSKTMSKTHARLLLSGDSWTITDLGSTNGSAVVGAAGEELELDAGVATSVTGRFTLGQFPLSLRREN